MTRLIDRPTTHTCSALERDRAYFAAQGCDLFRCGDTCPPITVHYAQFEMICAECRRECLDDSDVAAEACAWCGADHDAEPGS